MLDLITRFSMTEIFIFIILLAAGIRGCVSFYDWIVDRIRKEHNVRTLPETLHSETLLLFKKHDEKFDTLKRSQENLQGKQDEIEGVLEILGDKLDLLIESDKDDIKSYITEKYDLFVKEKKKIDKYNLDCIERRYQHYLEEDGNSFVADLMSEIRKLPVED